MGSFRLGAMAQGLSTNLGLFANNAAQEERERVRQQWELAMTNLREENAMAREGRQNTRQDARDTEQYARDDARFETTQETQRQTAALTAEHRKDTLQQNREQFDKKEVTAERRALEKRLESLRDNYNDDMEAAYNEDPNGDIGGRYMQARDEAVASFVVRMASATDSDGNLGAPGFKNIGSVEALSSKLITNGMSPDAADLRGGEIWGQLSGKGEELPAPNADQWQSSGNYQYTDETGKTVVGPAGLPDQALPASPALTAASPSVPGVNQTAVAAGTKPIDMVPPAGTGNDFFGEGGPGAGVPWAQPVAEWLGRPSNEMFGK